MAVHGINAIKGKSQDTGDWTVQGTTGKTVNDAKNKPLAGLSFQAADAAARNYLNRTGEWAAPVRG